ncbi:MAG: hypothetical protein KDE65_13255 [Burkholderiaceae bacterium]|nr:hypothetical protein [Burkholderiaceae bacterium]
MNTHICHFEALDTWFFREARPHGSVGSSELGSSFPPPVRTLLGALRTLIGDAWFAQHGGNWRTFASDGAHPLRALIGFGDDLGPLRASGPFLCLNGERLYPAPANLMVKEQGGQAHYFLLDLGSPVHCDLGRVHLPSFPGKVPGLQELAGSKPAENCWLTEAGLRAVLQGHAPASAQVVGKALLYAEEPRLGIGRDNARQSVQEGLVYQTRHLRLHPGVAVELRLHGLSDASLLPEQTALRLGGEGRMAGVTVKNDSALRLPGVPVDAKDAVFALYALTPTPCAPGLPAGIPAGFSPAQHNGADVWEGQLAGQQLRILSVACARPIREGGWDMASHQPRAVQSLLAAGSVLYVQNLASQAIDADAFSAHADTSGRGLCAAGLLPTHTTFQGSKP